MEFLSRYWFYFKRLWTVVWFYFLLALLWFGVNQTFFKKIVLTAAIALIFPLLAMAHQWLGSKYGQNDKDKGA